MYLCLLFSLFEEQPQTKDVGIDDQSLTLNDSNGSKGFSSHGKTVRAKRSLARKLPSPRD